MIVTFTQLWLDLLLRPRRLASTPLPPPPPEPPMVCPACDGWGRERRAQGHICPVCDGQGSVLVREAVRP